MEQFTTLSTNPNFFNNQNKKDFIQPSSINRQNQSINTIKEDKELYHFYKNEQLVFLVILLILIIVGNSLVLLTLVCNKRRKPRMNYFIKHLAYSDLLVGIVSVSSDITWKITLSFNGGNLLCKLVKYSQQLVIYASTYVLVMLSLDRYDAVINPLNFNTRSNRAKHMVFLAWFLSGLFSLPAIFLSKIQIKNSLPQCWIELKQNEWRFYFTMVSFLLFFIPAVIIIYCYAHIVKTIWFQRQIVSIDSKISRKKKIFKSNKISLNEENSIINKVKDDFLNIQIKDKKIIEKIDYLKNDDSQCFIPNLLKENQNIDYEHGNDFCENADKQTINQNNFITKLPALNEKINSNKWLKNSFFNNTIDTLDKNEEKYFFQNNLLENKSVEKNECMRINSQGIFPKAKIKTLKITFVIITVFIFCWSPYIIWDLLQVYGFIKRSAATNAISTFIQSLAPLNSAANPIIFCFFSSKEVFQTLKFLWKHLTFKRNKNLNQKVQINQSLSTIRKQNSTTSSSLRTTKSTTLSKSKSSEK